MLELFKNLRKLLKPMVERSGMAEKVQQAIYASGVVPLVLSNEPNELMNEAMAFFDGAEMPPLLMQLMKIYRREGRNRGFVYATYRLARLYQKRRPVETAEIYTPLLQLVVATIEQVNDPLDLLVYALEHLGYACEDRRDFTGAARSLWKGSQLSAEQGDVRAALHMAGYLLGDQFTPALGREGLPSRAALIQRLELLCPFVEGEHAIPTVVALASHYANEGDLARAHQMLAEMLAAFPGGPSDAELQPYWDQAQEVLRQITMALGDRPVAADRESLVRAAVFIKEDRFADAWAILDALPAPDDAFAAASYHAIRGQCLIQLTRFVDALTEIDAALPLIQAARGRPELVGEVVALRGEVLQRLQRFDESVDAYREAIRLMSSAGSDGVLAVRHNLANVMREHGRWADAEKGYDECLRIGEAMGDHSLVIRVTGNLGLLRFQQGRAEEGFAKLGEAIALATQFGDHWAAAHFRTALAQQQEQMEAADSAALDDAVGETGLQGNQMMRIVGTAVRARLSAKEGRRLDAARDYTAFWNELKVQIDNLAGAGDVARFLRMHHSALFSMAQFFFEEDDEAAAMRAIELARDGGLLLLRREASAQPGEHVPAELRERLARATNALMFASAELHFGRIADGAASLLQQARAEHGAVCDEIAAIDPAWARANLQVAAVAAAPDADLVIELCQTSAGTHFIFRKGEESTRVFASRDDGRPVGEVLFRAIRDHLPPQRSRIVFIPSGMWAGVAFHTLVDPDTGALLDDMHYVATAPSLGAMQRAQHAPVTGRGGLLVADPDGTLPGAIREADALQSRYGSLFQSRLDGAAADCTSVLAHVPAAGWLHFSCHGRFDANMPAQSVLKMADGLLTAEALLRVGRGYDGVVLSACEVGRSAVDGFDPLGMAGIFLSAGARCVLGPLWQIDDAASVIFMESLYTHLQHAPMGIAAAHARAELRAIPRYRESLYWAAYHVSGAPFHPAATPFAVG